MGQQNVTLRASGLYTFQNPLSSIPDGAFSAANNVIIDKNNIVNPRRGIKLYGNALGSPSDTAKQLILYKSRLIRHWGSELDADSDGQGDFTPMLNSSNTTAVVNEVSPGLRIKYAESNGNLYFTTNNGIQKISCNDITTLASQPVVNAGGIQALDGTATLNSAEGWFTEDSTVAYRLVWGITDANGNVILGAPSSRVVISNPMQTLVINDYNKLVYNLSLVAASPPVVVTGNLNATTTISSITTTNLSIGMTVADITNPTYIPANTKIVSIGTNSIVISNAATNTSTGDSLSFGQVLHDTDYASLKISQNSSSVLLYNSLLGLSKKLDTDMGETIYSGLSGTITNIAPTVSFTLKGDTNSNTTITGLPATTNIQAGMTVSATGILDGTTVVGPVMTGTSITISNAAQTTTTGSSTTFTFTKNTTVTSPSHGLTTGQQIQITGSNSSPVIDGIVRVTVIDSNTFTIPTITTIGGTSGTWTQYPLAIAQNFTTPPTDPATTQMLITLQTFLADIITALDADQNISTHAKATIGGNFGSVTTSATVNLDFTIPTGITTAYFYQIYRSALFSSTGPSTIQSVTPDDELQLIVEANPTAADLSNGFITYYDNVPETFRQGGAFLYTNANSGQGILQANTPPPLANDVCLYAGSMFYANTQTLYQQQIGLLTGLNLAGGYLTIANSASTATYKFVQDAVQIINIQAIDGNLFTQTGTADYFDIFSEGNATHYRVWFNIGSVTPPSSTGITLLECNISSLNSSGTANQVATQLSYTLTSVVDFTASVSSSIVTVTNETAGETNAPINHVSNSGFTLTVTQAGTGENISSGFIGASSAPTPAEEIDQTARSIVRVVNGNPSSIVNAYYVSSDTTVPGLILFVSKSYTTGNFYIGTNSNTISNNFTPSLGIVQPISAISVANPTHITSTAHGLLTGNQVIISGSNSTPSVDGVYTITKIDNNTFSIPVNVTISGNTGGFVPLTGAFAGSNDVRPNRLWYSKFQQPDAVPIVNFQDVGPRNKAILRILPLRDTLFILKEDGVYYLTGNTIQTFSIDLFDSSTIIKAPDSAVILSNQIFLFANQGITQISTTGVQIISRPIENLVVPLLTSQFTDFESSTFAVGYESDRAYLLFTIVNTDDTVATVCYRWNTITQTWTQWNISKTCGVVNVTQDLLYLGASDTDFIEMERKTFTRFDQADRQFNLTIPTNGVSGNQLSLGSLFNTEVGDAFVQTQYLTTYQFNRVLTLLDLDFGLNQHNYSILTTGPGFDLRNSLTLLAAKLDTDSGLATHGYSAAIAGYTSSFPDQQSAYNTITNMLNLDANTRFKHYPTSSGTVMFEGAVVAVNPKTLLITLDVANPFIAGTIVRYENIDSSITWAPHALGDPSLLKHISESTILFSNVDFNMATVSYASDLSTGFDSIPFEGDGPGAWGYGNWGKFNWGGDSSAQPIRTLVPVNKQKCRYINGQFEIAAALQTYSIYGISYTFNAVSNRAYR